jgi:c-di-GMP-related signal transduction protein
MGMFSLLDALIDRPMEGILQELNLCGEMRETLLNPRDRKTVLARILRLAIAYEGANWDQVQTEVGSLKIVSTDIARLYMESVNWVDELLAAI